MTDEILALEMVFIAIAKGFKGPDFKQFLESASNRANQTQRHGVVKELNRVIDLHSKVSNNNLEDLFTAWLR